MRELTLNLEHCYGITKLQESLVIEKTARNNGIFSIYAANGTLKTSLTKTFKDLQEQTDTKDLIFTERHTIRDITIDGSVLGEKEVFVIESYNESYSSNQISTLLVNNSLKQRYDDALKEINDKLQYLIKSLQSQSGISGKKETIQSVITSAFNKKENEFNQLVSEIFQTSKTDYTHLKDVKFSEIFNDKVISLINTDDFHSDLDEYIKTYETLIDNSLILSKNFNHQKADVITKSLGDTGFFSAAHSVNLMIGDEKKEITSQQDLKALITEERNKILDSSALKDKFSILDSKLKNVETQRFRDYISDNHHILPELKDLNNFKKILCISYLQANQSLWEDLVNTYTENQQIVLDIIDEAKRQRTMWESVVDIFNKRFSVPFKILIENQEEVILNNKSPTIGFEFNDQRNRKKVQQDGLIKILSQGEKRALYILNILFEIEIRKNSNHEQIVIIDDIADSFDYKNKYAIVEYLRDLSKIPTFHMIILTHNFDFHRILGSRLDIKRKNRLMAIRTDNKIFLTQEKYQHDVLSTWKQEFHSNINYALGGIPFARNLAEYCGHHDEYNKLTSLLHIKPDTHRFKISDLQEIYKNIFRDKGDLILQEGNVSIKDKLYSICDSLIQNRADSPDLESKVILAIAIRLKSEEYMIQKINDRLFVESITKNQTRLFDKYSELFPTEMAALVLLDQVNLMTPENIHLNSFMYEPILDMSAQRLYELYNEIDGLR